MNRIAIALLFMCYLSGSHLWAEEPTTYHSVLLENIKFSYFASHSGIVSLYVDEGDRVALGTKIADVGIEFLEIKIKLAEIDYQKALKRLRKTEAPLTRNEISLLEAKFNQKKELHAAGGISDDAFLIEKLQYELRVNPARPEDIEIAKAEAEEKRLAIELLKLELKYASFVTTLPGQITKIYIQKGKWVKTGEKILDFLCITPLQIPLNVPLDRLAMLKPGDFVPVTVNIGNRKVKVMGVIKYLINELDEIDQVGKILIELNNDDFQFKPGLRVDVEIP